MRTGFRSLWGHQWRNSMVECLAKEKRTSVAYSTLSQSNNTASKFLYQIKTKEFVSFQQSCFISTGRMDADYGKYAEPGKLESFYEWFTDSSWIHSVESYLITTHDITGLPWWASIAVCTIALRGVVMTPLMVAQMRNSVKYQQFLSIFMPVQKRVVSDVSEAAKEHNWDDSQKLLHYQLNIQRHKTNLMRKYKVPGFFKRYLLPWVQIPLWVSMSISLRHLTLSLPLNSPLSNDIHAVASQMSQEGILWFSNLCVADPYFVMPFLLGIVNLGVIEIYRGDGKTKPVGIGKVIIYAMRFLSVLMVPIACQMPSGVVFYWLCSSTYGATQALVFRSHRIRRFFKIPVSSTESKTPYRDLYVRLPFIKATK